MKAFNDTRSRVVLTDDDPSSRVSEEFHAFSYHGPISYGNMISEGSGPSNSSLRRTWIGGDQYLAVTYMPFSEDEDISAEEQLLTLEYELALDAVGEEIDPPVFAEISAQEETETNSPTASPEQSSEPTEVDAQNSATESEGMSLTWILVSVIVILAIAIGAFIAGRNAATKKK